MHNRAVNLVSLTSIQVCNALLPLLIFPFVLAVVGQQRYSQLVLAEALAIALLTVVLYSFEVDGVAQVVGLDAHRDHAEISRVFSTIAYLRLALFGAAGVLLTAGVVLFDIQLAVLLACWLLVPLSYALQPGWLYQGLERNAPIAVCTATSRVAAVGLVFALVHGEADYLLVPLLVGGAYVAGSLAAMYHARSSLGVRFVAVPYAELRAALCSGKEIFLGNFGVLLYRDMNVVVLGVLGTSAAGVAGYSLAEKIAKSIQAAMRPLNQLFFPRALHLARSASKPSPTVLRQLLRLTWPQLGALAAFLVTGFAAYGVFGDELPWLKRIQDVQHVVVLVGLMSLASFFGISNFMFGVAGLNAMQQRSYLFRAILATAACSLAACFTLAWLHGEIGAAVSFVLAEVCLFGLIVRKYLQ